MHFGRLRLRTQLIILITAAMLATIALLIALSIVQIQQILLDNVAQRARLLTEANADVIGPRLAASEFDEVDAIVGASVRQQVVDGVSVFDSAGRPLLERGLTNDPARRQYEQALVQQALATGQTAEMRESVTAIFAVPARADSGVQGVLVATTHASEASSGTVQILIRMLVVGVSLALLTILAVFIVASYATRPLHALSLAAAAIGQGQFVAPRASGRGGEIGELERAFGQMAHGLQSSRAAIEMQNTSLEQRVAERTAELERIVAELSETSAAREQLSAAIRELSSPVAPVLEGILVMPLVGAIDSQRAELLLTDLLAAVERRRARFVIMDVTGVPIVDTHVARTLLEAAAAARLLGAQTVLVGLRPEIAQTIVGLGLDFSALVTHADLQSGVEYAMRRQGRE